MSVNDLHDVMVIPSENFHHLALKGGYIIPPINTAGARYSYFLANTSYLKGGWVGFGWCCYVLHYLQSFGSGVFFFNINRNHEDKEEQQDLGNV